MDIQTPALLIEGKLYDERTSDEHDAYSSPQSLTDGLDDTDSSDLRSLLCKDAIRHADTKTFWSSKRVRDIITVPRIVEQLHKHGHSHDRAQSIAHKISGSCLQIFAALTWHEREGDIGAFLREGIVDSDLPFVRAEVKNAHLTCKIARRDQPSAPLACFSNWSISAREFFLSEQHRFVPAVFGFEPGTNTIRHMNYSPAVVLPLTQSKAIRDGGFGSVKEVEVHPDCHGFHDILHSIIIDNRFAVKQLHYEEDDQAFQGEVAALKRFNGFVHPHLVTLLMTWTLLDQHYFLFPLAGCNLEDYWNNNQPWVKQATLDIAVIQWVSKQVEGLASAIDTVHNPSATQYLGQNKRYGRHGDIKPENVLWYRSPEDPKGILVIADLGLSKINTEKSRSNIPNRNIPFTPGYRPPECDLEGGTISRAYDIWTFGCLLLELVTWALGGEISRVTFEDKRMSPYITGSQSDIFFDVKKRDGHPGFVIMVKETVTEWIAILHGMNTCTRYFHDLLDLIEDHMLVTLSQNQSRGSSSEILQRIRTLHGKVMDPLNIYCRQPCPQQRPPRFETPVQANLNSHAKGEIRTRRIKLSVYDGKETVRPRTREQLAALN